MLKKDKNIIVREKLMTQKDVVFTCGHKDTLGRIQKYKVYTSDPSDVMSFAITENSSFGKMMNVNKFGPTCITLYTFDMFGRKIVGKIKYANVRFVANEQFECENPLKKIPGFLGTEKG